jgi:hypothetical protein
MRNQFILVDMEADDSDEEVDPFPAEWIQTGFGEYSVAATWERE